MIKKITSLYLIILINIPMMAQTEKKQNFFAKSIKWVTNYIERVSMKGYDTTYVCLPKYKWLASISTNFAGVRSSVIGSSIPNYGDLTIKLRSALSGQSTISLGYRGYALGYSRDIFNGYSSNLSLSLLKKSWGIEYRRHSTNGVHGTMHSSTTGKELDVTQNDINVKTTLIDGYIIFNYKKFTYTGTAIPSLIQKRSAGSLLVVGGYISSKITANDESLKDKINGIKQIEVSQGTIGLGYGYDYSIDQGKILIYTSLIPMAVIHNNDLVTFDYTTKLADGTTTTMELCKKIETKRKINFTGVARISANYNINDRYVVRVNGILNDIRFKSTDGLSVKTYDWYCDVMFGIRF